MSYESLVHLCCRTERQAACTNLFEDLVLFRLRHYVRQRGYEKYSIIVSLEGIGLVAELAKINMEKEGWVCAD